MMERDSLQHYRTHTESPEILAAIQGEFQESLHTLAPHQINKLPDLSDLISHNGTYTSGIEGKLRPGMFLSEQFLDGAAQIHEGKPTEFTFDVKPMLRLSREDSRRKVFFGNLNVGWKDSGEQQVVRVAVKPFDPKNRDTALHECGMYQYMENEGLSTLHPLGVFIPPNGNGEIYALTHFNPTVITMDNVLWHELSEEEVSERLEVALDTLAMMHSRLLFHGDFEFKNVAYGEAEGDVVIVDPELTVSGRNLIEEGMTEPPIRIVQMMSRDFTDLCKSIQSFVFSTRPEEARPTNDFAIFADHLQNVFTPYQKKLLAQNSPHRDLLLKAYKEMVGNKRRQAAGE